MNNQEIEDKIEDFVNAEKPFTAYDITRALRESGTQVSNSKVRNMVYGDFPFSFMSPKQWGTTTIEVINNKGETVNAELYHLIDDEDRLDELYPQSKRVDKNIILLAGNIDIPLSKIFGTTFTDPVPPVDVTITSTSSSTPATNSTDMNFDNSQQKVLSQQVVDKSIVDVVKEKFFTTKKSITSFVLKNLKFLY